MESPRASRRWHTGDCSRPPTRAAQGVGGVRGSSSGECLTGGVRRISDLRRRQSLLGIGEGNGVRTRRLEGKDSWLFHPGISLDSTTPSLPECSHIVGPSALVGAISPTHRDETHSLCFLVTPLISSLFSSIEIELSVSSHTHKPYDLHPMPIYFSIYSIMIHLISVFVSAQLPFTSTYIHQPGHILWHIYLYGTSYNIQSISMDTLSRHLPLYIFVLQPHPLSIFNL